MKESDLYPSVRKFIRDKFNCFYDCIEAGILGIGSVDVFGVYSKNLKSEIETVGAEVKLVKYETQPAICKNFGQAKSYSLFCHRVYYASHNMKYNEEEIEAARHLSIGLIEINFENKNLVCSEVLEAPIIPPVKKMQDYVLRYKGIFQCELCRVFQHSNLTEVSTKPTEWTKKEIEKGKGLLIKSTEKEDFYCNTCARIKLKV
jgi:hypothetical protein